MFQYTPTEKLLLNDKVLAGHSSLATILLTQALIRRKSLTPDDVNCQSLIWAILRQAGFRAVRTFDQHTGLTNTLYYRQGASAYAEQDLEGKEFFVDSDFTSLDYQDLPQLDTVKVLNLAEPVFCFAGHTDVVPTGPTSHWKLFPWGGDLVVGDELLIDLIAKNEHQEAVRSCQLQASQARTANPDIKPVVEQTNSPRYEQINALIQQQEVQQSLDSLRKSLSATQADAFAREEAERYALTHPIVDHEFMINLLEQGQPADIYNRLEVYGRGACDMKGDLAASVIALYNFAKSNPEHQGTLVLLVTSDEEGDAIAGTDLVIKHLERMGQTLHYSLVGEPSSYETMGDNLRNGRRGSATWKIKVKGVQGHVAYPHLVQNPIHLASGFLAELASYDFDGGRVNANFPATSLQITDVHAGTNTSNLVPGELDLMFNIRFNDFHTYAGLQEIINNLLEKHKLTDCIDLSSSCSGESFVTDKNTAYVAQVRQAIHEITHLPLEQIGADTAGGTSDGRFIARISTNIIELGVINKTLHKVDERAKVKELVDLKDVYIRILEKIIAS